MYHVAQDKRAPQQVQYKSGTLIMEHAHTHSYTHMHGMNTLRPTVHK